MFEHIRPDGFSQGFYLEDRADVVNEVRMETTSNPDAVTVSDAADQLRFSKYNQGCKLFRARHQAKCGLGDGEFLMIRIRTEGGNDRIVLSGAFPKQTGYFDSKIDTGDGADRIVGGPQGENLLPGEGDDSVRGGGGADLISASRHADGHDVLSGGPGHDAIDYSRMAKPARIDLRRSSKGGPLGEFDRLTGFEDAFTGSRRDLVIAGPENNLINVDSGSSVVRSGAGGDTIFLGSGRDKLKAGRGSDYIFNCCNRERDVIRCGPGFDRVASRKAGKLIGCEGRIKFEPLRGAVAAALRRYQEFLGSTE